MSWQNEMVVTIRHYLNDLSTTPTYTDDRLTELILISANQVLQEVSFNNQYVVSIDNLSLSPDPTQTSPRDDSMMWLVVLKAISVIGQSEYRTFSSQAVLVKDGERQIDMRAVSLAKQKYAQDTQEDYENARWLYTAANRQAGTAVLGPFGFLTATFYGSAGGWQFYTPRDRPLFN